MSDLAVKFLDGYGERYAGVVEETVTTLGEAEALVLTAIHDDFLTIRDAILCQYTPDAAFDSLLFSSLCSLPKKLYDLQADFLRARYDEIGREVRFIWEMTCRTRITDKRNEGESLGKKGSWLQEQEDKRRLNWNTTLLPTLSELFADEQLSEIERQFKPIWDRFNQVCHPSVDWLVNCMDSSDRLLFNHFDERFARQTLSDIRQVMALVFVVLIFTFPDIGWRLASDETLFEECPAVRMFLPTKFPHAGTPEHTEIRHEVV